MTWINPCLEAVIRWLGERTGLTFPANRIDSAQMGITRAMHRAGLCDPKDYLGLIQRDSNAFDDLVVELTVGETYFFREPAQFEFIRRDVLPEIRKRRGANHTLRVWSAACASGEEPFSLAILFEQEGLGDKVHLLATDISREALAKARRAVYGSWSLRGDSGKLAQPYLECQQNLFSVADRIRRRVHFEHLNLSLNVYPSFATGTWGMDLILCRNVLIYFDWATVCQVARQLYESLAPGGWLIAASSDPPLGEVAPFKTVVSQEGVFYRRSEGGKLEDSQRRESGKENNKDTLSFFTCNEQASPPSYQQTGPVVLDSLPSPLVSAPATQNQLEEAHEALQRGDYAVAGELACQLVKDPEAAALHVRSLANLETNRAEQACVTAIVRHPLSAELHYLHGVLLMELGRDEEAAKAVRRVIYLDRSLAIAHFTLGAILGRSGDLQGARRAYRNVIKLCADRPANEIVPLSDGECADRLANAAKAELAILDAAQEVS